MPFVFLFQASQPKRPCIGRNVILNVYREKPRIRGLATGQEMKMLKLLKLLETHDLKSTIVLQRDRTITKFYCICLHQYTGLSHMMWLQSLMCMVTYRSMSSICRHMLVETTLPLLFLVRLLRQLTLLFLWQNCRGYCHQVCMGYTLQTNPTPGFLLPCACICSMSVCLYVCQQNASSRLAKCSQISYSIQTSSVPDSS